MQKPALICQQIKGGKSMKKILFICIPFFIFILFYPGTNVHATTHSHTNQDVTAYISTNSTYFGTRAVPYKTVAVHPKKRYFVNSGTIYPYGASIKTSKKLYLNGYGYKSTFTVEDMGDLKYHWTKYWFDIYFGKTNISDTSKFGLKHVNYTVTY